MKVIDGRESFLRSMKLLIFFSFLPTGETPAAVQHNHASRTKAHILLLEFLITTYTAAMHISKNIAHT